MRSLLPEDRPLLLLAPMQDITDLPFMRVMERLAEGPDVYVTEYFRVHAESRLDRKILRSIDENPSEKPVLAQMIGHSIPDLVRTAKALEEHPVAGIDLNLGCPAPVVCRKLAGGGLLRDRQHLDAVLGHLREAISGRFTVKTRLGYHGAEEFETLLPLFARHSLDALSIHGRTVEERYRTAIHPEWIRAAVETMECPVFANGNVVSVETGEALWKRTGAAGLMIGRGAIRNPWLFEQLRARWSRPEEEVRVPRLGDLYGYIEALYEETKDWSHYDPCKHVKQMKKLMIFIVEGIDPEGGFERDIRRVGTPEAFWNLCDEWLKAREDLPLPPQPSEGSSIFCGFSSLLAEG